MRKLENSLFVIALIVFIVGAVTELDWVMYVAFGILVLGFIGVTPLSLFLKLASSRGGQSSPWVSDQLDDEVAQSDPSTEELREGLRVPYSKYQIEKRELLEFLRKFDSRGKCRVMDRIMTVGELTYEVECQTEFGKECVQHFVEQDGEYLGLITEEVTNDA